MATVVVLVLNPAQLLAEARDGRRLSDLKTLNTALSLYLTTVRTPTLAGPAGNGGFSCSTQCSVHNTSGTVGANCGGRHTGTATTTGSIFDRDVAGIGWVKVDFSAITGAPVLATLPIDPVSASGASTGCGNSGCFYSYACNDVSKTFELNASMESVRYSSGGAGDVEGKDGGSSTTIYEIGNAPGLTL